MAHNLNQFNFGNDLQQILSDHGYTSALQVAESLRISPDLAATALKTDINDIQNILPDTTSVARNDTRFSMGAVLENVPVPAMAFSLVPSSLALPASVNLIPQMPTIRNQGPRGTCVAFSTLAVLEHRLHGGQPNNHEDMSEQFQYCMCKLLDGIPNLEGTYLGTSFPSLGSNGCCREITWPYNSAIIPGNEGQGPVPANAAAEAPTFVQPTVKPVPQNSIRALKAELAAGRCVAFSIPVFDTWYDNQDVQDSGDLVMPWESEAVVGGHAMCLVGYFDSNEPGNPGGGRFILRNSWGTTWGSSSPYGPGYGTIPYDYMAQYAKEAYTIG